VLLVGFSGFLFLCLRQDLFHETKSRSEEECIVDVNEWPFVFSLPERKKERKKSDNIHETKPMRERDLSRVTLATTTALIIICGFVIGSGIVQFHFNH
jgi:hypothetical protein